MIKYREIFRLHSQGVSQRGIAASCQSSRTTIRNVLERAERHEISWPFEKDMTGVELQELLFPEKSSQSNRKLPDCEHIHKEMPGRFRSCPWQIPESPSRCQSPMTLKHKHIFVKAVLFRSFQEDISISSVKTGYGSFAAFVPGNPGILSGIPGFPKRTFLDNALTH